MKKISIWSIIKLVTVLAQEINSVLKDGKITIQEGIGIMRVVCESLGIEMDSAGLDVDTLIKTVNLINEKRKVKLNG